MIDPLADSPAARGRATQLPLVCPQCRRADDGGLHVWTLEDAAGGLQCRGCQARYPIVDGIPVIARDLAPLLAEDPAKGDAIASIYARSWDGPLQDWLRRVVPAGALELAGGVGIHPTSTVLDRSLAMLRRGTSADRVCGDLLDPPFLPASCACVVLANVLDILHEPVLAFQQAVALTAPGGIIVVTCPYSFTHASPDCHVEWFSEAQLHGGLGAIEAGLLELETLVELDWPLRTTDRLTQVHRTDAMVFRRLGG